VIIVLNVNIVLLAADCLIRRDSAWTGVVSALFPRGVQAALFGHTVAGEVACGSPLQCVRSIFGAHVYRITGTTLEFIVFIEVAGAVETSGARVTSIFGICCRVTRSEKR
jgi:hypothetical protein